jgi:hypothetical protein
LTSVVANRTNSRLLSSVAILLTFSAAVAACGGSSLSGQAGSSPASSPTASAAPAGGYSANLTFTGALSGAVTSAKAPKVAACADGVGHLTVGFNLNGHDYDILLTTVGYKGAGKYSLGDGSTGTLLMLSDSQYGGRSLFMSTSGSVTYINAKSVTLDGDLADQTGGGGNAHVSGTASCA